jgi:hypothetical protein
MYIHVRMVASGYLYMPSGNRMHALCCFPNLVTKLCTVLASDEEVPQSHDRLIVEADVPRSSV